MTTRVARDFALRRCSTDDARMIASLGARLFTEAYGPTHPEPELSRYLARSFAPDAVGDALADDTVTMFVVEDLSSRPIGYAFLRRTGELPDGVTNPNSCEVVRFYVEAAAHGRGVGTALMEKCFEDTRQRGAELIWVQVWKEAPWAVGFYQRMGFSVVGSAPFYFGDRISDDHIMSRSL